MPGFVTHMIMGEQCIEKMPEVRLRSLLKCFPFSFNLGLMGPDIYYHYPAGFLKNGFRNIGNIMHEQGTKKYFNTAMDLLRSMEDGDVRNYCSAYFAGFICHYLTDAICHPYIYSRIDYDYNRNPRRAFGRHSELEEELDIIMLRSFKGIFPRQLDFSSIFRGTEIEQAAIAVFMSDTVNKTYGSDSSLAFYLNEETASHIISFFLKKTALKRLPDICTQSEEKLLNIDKTSWADCWDRKILSDKSFPELFIQALNGCSASMRLLNEFLMTDSIDIENDLLKYLGNRSYQTGRIVKELV